MNSHILYKSKWFVLALIILFSGTGLNNISFAQEIKPKGTLEKLIYPTENMQWIDFIPDNKLNPVTVFEDFRNDFNLSKDDRMVLLKKDDDDIGYSHYFFQQYNQGIKIDDANLTVHTNGESIKSINGKTISGINIKPVQYIEESLALNLALNEIKSKKYLWLNPDYEKQIKELHNDNAATYFPKGELVFHSLNRSSNTKGSDYKLCWQFDIRVEEAKLNARIFIDAFSGNRIDQLPLSLDCFQGSGATVWNGTRDLWTAYNAVSGYKLHNNTCPINLPADIHVWNQNNNSSAATEYTDADNTWNQSAAVQSFWGLTQTYNYYQTTHSRNSWNNSFGNIYLYNDVPSGVTTNGCWGCQGNVISLSFNGNSTSGDNFNCLDIVGHEFTHGVTQSSAAGGSGLNYQNESGALNESFSDIFGECVEQFATGSHDWLHGEDRGANRSFFNPLSFGQPETYLGTNWCDYNNQGLPCTSNDNGGVHTNSGVQNFWFYLLSDGGSGWNNGDTADALPGDGYFYSVSGIGMEDAAKIAYRALTQYFSLSSAQYIDSRAASIHAANDLFGNCSNQSIQVANAWYAVGVGPQSPAYNTNICGSLNGNYYGINSVQNNCNTSVASGITSNMSAKTLVVLNAPFYANNGSTFKAYLGEPCALTGYKSAAGTTDYENEKMTDLSINSNLLVNPNPFNNKTNISYKLMQNEKVDLKIYNAQMQLVKTLLSTSFQKEGNHSVEFDAKELEQGIYFCRLQAGNEIHSVKLVVTK